MGGIGVMSGFWKTNFQLPSNCLFSNNFNFCQLEGVPHASFKLEPWTMQKSNQVLLVLPGTEIVTSPRSVLCFLSLLVASFSLLVTWQACQVTSKERKPKYHSWCQLRNEWGFQEYHFISTVHCCIFRFEYWYNISLVNLSCSHRAGW